MAVVQKANFYPRQLAHPSQLKKHRDNVEKVREAWDDKGLRSIKLISECTGLSRTAVTKALRKLRLYSQREGGRPAKVDIPMDKVKELYTKGHTFKEIAEILGVSYGTLCKRTHGIRVTSNNWLSTQDRDRKIVELRKAGWKHEDIAAEVGLSKGYVMRIWANRVYLGLVDDIYGEGLDGPDEKTKPRKKYTYKKGSGSNMIKGETHKDRRARRKKNMEATRKAFHLGTTTLKGLALEVGVSPSTISTYLVELGLKPDNHYSRGPKAIQDKTITKTMADDILMLFESGEDKKVIAKTWGITQVMVTKVIKGTAKIV